MTEQKTEQKHTPGPWRYWPCKVDSSLTPPMYDYVQFASPIGHVFRVPIQFLSEADARLIAAAPELLEALKDCRRALELAIATGELAVVDAAIAKATGQEAA